METAQTAGYALRVLRLLHTEDGQTVAQMATALDLSRSVAQRIVTSLHDHAAVLRGPDGRYWLGPMLISIAQHVPEPIVAIGGRILDELTAQTGETVVLAVPDGDDARVVDARTGHRGQLRIEYEVGFTHSLSRGASGLSILAFLPADRIPIGMDHLKDQLDEVRRSGYSRTEGQLRGQMVGLAVPIQTDGGPVGSLAIITPSARGGQIEAQLPALQASATEIEQGLRSRARGTSRASRSEGIQP